LLPAPHAVVLTEEFGCSTEVSGPKVTEEMKGVRGKTRLRWFKDNSIGRVSWKQNLVIHSGNGVYQVLSRFVFSYIATHTKNAKHFDREKSGLVKDGITVSCKRAGLDNVDLQGFTMHSLQVGDRGFGEDWVNAESLLNSVPARRQGMPASSLVHTFVFFVLSLLKDVVDFKFQFNLNQRLTIPNMARLPFQI